jgi:hypothetical protein
MENRKFLKRFGVPVPSDFEHFIEAADALHQLCVEVLSTAVPKVSPTMCASDDGHKLERPLPSCWGGSQPL